MNFQIFNLPMDAKCTYWTTLCLKSWTCRINKALMIKYILKNPTRHIHNATCSHQLICRENRQMYYCALTKTTVPKQASLLTQSMIIRSNNKVSFCKQIARQQSWHKIFWPGRGRPCKIIPSSSLTTTQNLVTVSHTVCARLGGSENFGDDEAQRALEFKHAHSPRVTIPNLVALGQTVRA